MMKRSPGEAARAILGIIAPAGNGRGMGPMGGEAESEDDGEDLGTAALGAAASELIDAVKKGDKSAAAEALQAAFSACYSMHEEED